MPYIIEFARSAQKDLQKLPHEQRQRIARRVDRLAENPRPPDVTKLSGFEDVYRIRVGDYRVVYEIQDQRLLIFVIRIGHRGDVYRKFGL